MMKKRILLATVCVCLMLRGPGGAVAQSLRQASLDLSDMQMARAVDTRIADVTFASRASAAVDRVLPSIEANLVSQETINKQAFDAGIDVKQPTTEAFGPHLLTTQAALDIERAGQAFLGVSEKVAGSLNVPTMERAMTFDGISIAPPRLPPRAVCPYNRWSWPTCNRTARYRTVDGSCNNLDNPLWGKAATPFERFIPPWYDDGVSSPRTVSFHDGQLPLPRKISYTFHLPLSYKMPDLSHLAMEYGQFISHDIQFNALSRGYAGSNLDCCQRPNRHSCFPIKIPSDDPFFTGRTCMNFVRSIPTPKLDCTLGARQQLNQNTHFHDGSQVYGSDTRTANSLRTFSGGLLKTSGDLLPKDTANNAGCILSNQNRPCFRAGDVRVNQQPGLMSFQTIWMREHNTIARKLAEVQPAWRSDDEKLYQEARRIVIAMMQHITYKEYLPIILGNTNMNKYGLKPRSFGFFHGYNDTEKPMIRNGFSAAAFRFGHSMIADKLPTHNGFTTTSNKYLKDVFIRPDLIYEQGIDGVTRGLTRSRSEKVDRYISPQVSRHLFERQPRQGGDLIATNINRGRDHGLPNYQMWRRYCNLPGQYSHTSQVRQALQNVYAHPNDMDLFTAGVSETPMPGAKVGPTFACLIGEQFRSLKTGDRYFYENSGPHAFTLDQLKEIKKMTMSKIICRNTGITSIQRNAFKDVVAGNPLVNCRSISDIDLGAWGTSGGGCIPVHGGWSPWQTTPCFGQWKLKYRTCTNPAPNSCGRPCSSQPYEIQIEFCGFNPFPDFPWRGGARLFDSMSLDSQAVAPQKGGVLDQVRKSLSGLVADGQTNIDASVFEKAISSVGKATSNTHIEPVRDLPRPRPDLTGPLEPRVPDFRDLRNFQRLA